MTETPVVTVFLRNGGDVLLLRRSDAVGSYPGKWGGVAGHLADDEGQDRAPEAAARAEIAEETGIADADVSLVRAGDPFAVDDPDRDDRWLVHPFLFDCESRAVETNEETAEYEWTSPTAIRRRETVPALWTSYDRVRPRVATVREDREHGSAWLSIRALEVFRDEAALAETGRSVSADGEPDHERREADGDDWDALTDLARRLRDARPSMAVVANRVNRAMVEAMEEETRSPVAVKAAASEGIDRALSADADAAANAAERLGVAESLAPDCEVTLTTDAAFPFELDAWDAEALVVGADRVLPDGRVVNKVGTRAAALAAPDDCPCYVVAASDKVSTDETVDLAERDATEVYDGDATVRVANPTFDVTPAGAVDAVNTETGVLDADDVARVAERHRERADWD